MRQGFQDWQSPQNPMHNPQPEKVAFYGPLSNIAKGIFGWGKGEAQSAASDVVTDVVTDAAGEVVGDTAGVATGVASGNKKGVATKGGKAAVGGLLGSEAANTIGAFTGIGGAIGSILNPTEAHADTNVQADTVASLEAQFQHYQQKYIETGDPAWMAEMQAIAAQIQGLKAQGLNQGGTVDLNDPTNRDTVPAMLTPGEFVLNKEASQMFRPQIEAMNEAGLEQRKRENDMVKRNMGGPLAVRGYADGTQTYDGVTREEWEAYLNDPNTTDEEVKWEVQQIGGGQLPQWLTELLMTTAYSRPGVMQQLDLHTQRMITGWYEENAGKENVDQGDLKLTRDERMQLDYDRLLEEAGGLLPDGTVPLRVRTEMAKLYPETGALHKVVDQRPVAYEDAMNANREAGPLAQGLAAGQAPYENSGLHSNDAVDVIMRSKITNNQEKAKRIIDLVNDGTINKFRARDILKSLGVNPYEAGSGLGPQDRAALGLTGRVVGERNAPEYQDAMNADRVPAMQVAPPGQQDRLAAILKGKLTTPEEKARAILDGMRNGTIDKAAGQQAVQSLGTTGSTGSGTRGSAKPKAAEVPAMGAPVPNTHSTVGGGLDPKDVADPRHKFHKKYHNLPMDWFAKDDSGKFVTNNDSPVLGGVQFTGGKKGQRLQDKDGNEIAKGTKMFNQLTGQHWVYGED